MKWVNRFIIIFAIFLALVLIANFVYKGLTKKYYTCEKCDEKFYPKLEGKGVQIKDIWLCPLCYSILDLEAGRGLSMGNLEDGDPWEAMSVERRKWIYEEAKGLDYEPDK